LSARDRLVCSALGVHFERPGRIWDRSVGVRRTILEVDMSLLVDGKGFRRIMERWVRTPKFWVWEWWEDCAADCLSIIFSGQVPDWDRVY